MTLNQAPEIRVHIIHAYTVMHVCGVYFHSLTVSISLEGSTQHSGTTEYLWPSCSTYVRLLMCMYMYMYIAWFVRLKKDVLTLQLRFLALVTIE